MKELKKTFLLFLAIVITAAMIETCGFPSPPVEQEVVAVEALEANNFILNQWKAEKEFLQTRYERRVVYLQATNDSLEKIVADDKKLFAAHRFKTRFLQKEVKSLLQKADSTKLLPDSLITLTDELIASQQQSDSTCVETVYSLEEVIENKDSILSVQRKAMNNLRDLNQEEALRIMHLTDQLNTSLKSQKKKTRNNRFLKGSLVFISGIAATTFLVQKLK